MFIAKCIFENNKGYSKPYSYEVSKKQMAELSEGDHFVVSQARGDYAVAIIDAFGVTSNPETKKLVTQHVCCKVVDEFTKEDTDEPITIRGTEFIPLKWEDAEEE